MDEEVWRKDSPKEEEMKGPDLPTEHERKRFLEVFRKNLCQLGRTCEELHLANTTVVEWRRMYPEFNLAYTEAITLLCEKVEQNLIEKAMDDNMLAMIFFLKNNWREKYGERTALEIERPTLWFEKQERTQITEGEDAESSGEIHPALLAGADSREPEEESPARPDEV